jgi:hypothetical protein
MTLWKRALPVAALSCFALFGAACLTGGGSDDPTPIASPSPPQADVEASHTAVVGSPTATPWPTVLPAKPLDATYVVQSGDNPTLIAEYAHVPAAEQDAWIAQLLTLNNTDAHSLSVGQKLILPPLANGTLPTIDQAAVAANAGSAGGGGSGDASLPPNFVLAQPIPQGTATPTPPTGLNGVPIMPTPPFVAFTSPTATPTATSTPKPIFPPTATPKPIFPAGARAWLTASEETAVYYYCDLDTGWKSIPTDKLVAFDSEQQLLAVWGRFRTKAPNSVC